MMKRIQTTWYYQQGYGGIEAFLAACIVGAVIYFFFFPSRFRTPSETAGITECVYAAPSTTDTIQTGGQKYGLIKPGAFIIQGEVEAHFRKEGKVSIRGEEYDVYRATEDITAPGTAGTISAANYGEGAQNLRFVDVTNAISHIQKGVNIYDVYLLEGRPIPAFILEYCLAQKAFKPLLIWQDTSKGSLPPLSFNSDQLTNLQPGIGCTSGDPVLEPFCKPFPANTTYNLFSYRQRDFFLGAGTSLITNGSCPAYYPVLFGPSVLSVLNGKCNLYYHGDLPVTYLSKTVTYRVEHLLGPIDQVVLLDTDPASPYYGYQFQYAPEKFIDIIDLNTNVTADWDEQTLQLKAFTPFIVNAWGWWTPECKPAVYLYPEKEQLVNVQVTMTNGFLTYTDPLYPKGGWNVFAKPSGQLHYLGNTFASSKGVVNYPTGIFPYLYYEGKVSDSAVIKPEAGYVTRYEALESFFAEVLPRLGLNAKEGKEFTEYWLKALPYASYYFIGILPQEVLNTQEPLTISPKEDTMIRVRLYFEALDKPQSVKEPEIVTPQRDGFTVVDWGGMVKQDTKHPFTCLQ